MLRTAMRLALFGLLLLLPGCFPDLREKSRRAVDENATPIVPDTAGLRHHRQDGDNPGNSGKSGDTLRPRMALRSTE